VRFCYISSKKERHQINEKVFGLLLHWAGILGFYCTSIRLGDEFIELLASLLEDDEGANS